MDGTTSADPAPDPKPGDLAHFAINVDDVDEARRFYTAVFGWRFEPWAAPGFFQVTKESGERPGPIGALQQRRYLEEGLRLAGFECTVAVADVDAVLAAVKAHGGRVLMDKTTLAGVGDLVFFADPSGNVCGAMRYDSTAE
jgi:predicted enzyme related to lactoylglutathione lyase